MFMYFGKIDTNLYLSSRFDYNTMVAILVFNNMMGAAGCVCASLLALFLIVTLKVKAVTLFIFNNKLG